MLQSFGFWERGLAKKVMKYLRTQDQLENIGEIPPGALSPSEFSGTWLNTNTDNPGIVSVSCKVEGNVLRVRFEGNGSSEPPDWDEASAELLCAANVHGGPAMSFVAFFDLGFKKVRAGANLNQGLLVIALYHSFENNDGGRSDYFSREFFCRTTQS